MRRAAGPRAALVLAAAIAAVVPVAPARARHDLNADYVRAARYLEAWRFEDARALISKLAAVAPNAPEQHYLEAEMAFMDGDYQGALDRLGRLPDSGVGGDVGDLRELSQSTLDVTRGFAQARSAGGHFVLFYPPGKDQALVDLAGQTLEAAYAALDQDLGYHPPGPVRVEILSQPRDLARVSTLTEKEIETTGTIALCKYGKLMVVTPRATVFGYPWMDTLNHEYTHYVVSRLSHDRVPVWLQEGLAKFEQVRWRGPGQRPLSPVDEHLLATALRKDKLITFDAMYPSMAKLPSQKAAALAFAEVVTMVGYIEHQAGYAGLRRIIALTRSGKGARKAVAEVMSAPFAEVEKRWKNYLRGQRLKSSPALAERASSRRIRFRQGNSSDENVGADQVSSARARRFTRLGGLLRARGMHKAAAVEYEKALAIAGPGDPFVAGKLSRTYFELENYSRAIELAKPLAEADETDAAPATTLGMSYLATGKPADAAKAFEIALRVTPFDPAVRCGLAQAYGALGQKPLAARETRACQLVRE